MGDLFCVHMHTYAHQYVLLYISVTVPLPGKFSCFLFSQTVRALELCQLKLQHVSPGIQSLRDVEERFWVYCY